MTQGKLLMSEKIHIPEVGIKEKSLWDEKLEMFQKYFPESLSKDPESGRYLLNMKSLQENLDPRTIQSDQSQYGLNWVGKKLAKGEAYTLNSKLIKPLPTESKNFNDTQNILIKGDNLDALRLLRQSYTGKVKMIYIDPPYNTKSDAFIYHDNFSLKEEEILEKMELEESEKDYVDNIYSAQTHSGWLSFMYPRLVLARELLKEDGVIFISIDDNEQAQLKLLMDEIFGEDNFVGNFIWEKTYSPKNNNKYVSVNHDYILCYSKNLNVLTHLNKLERTDENNKQYKYNDKDGRGLYRLSDLTIGDKKGYDIHWNGKVYKERPTRGWVYSKERMYELIKEGKIYLPQDESKSPAFKRYLNDVEGVISKTILPHSLVGHTDKAKKQLYNLLNHASFDYPKPTDLIKYFLKLITSQDSNDIILDFFAGSGTTGQAVMEMNQEDGGNRQYILVQIPQETNPKSEAYKAGYKTIFDITKVRLEKAGDKIEQQLSAFHKVDTGFKTFEMIEDKSFIMKNPLSDFDQDLLEKIEKILLESDYESLVYTFMSYHGFDLNEEVKTLIPYVLYQVNTQLFLFKSMDKEELLRIIEENSIKEIYLYSPTLDKDKFTLEIQKDLIIQGHEKKIRLLK